MRTLIKWIFKIIAIILFVAGFFVMLPVTICVDIFYWYFKFDDLGDFTFKVASIIKDIWEW